jgi:hypothetical protein
MADFVHENSIQPNKKHGCGHQLKCDELCVLNKSVEIEALFSLGRIGE